MNRTSVISSPFCARRSSSLACLIELARPTSSSKEFRKVSMRFPQTEERVVVSSEARGEFLFRRRAAAAAARSCGLFRRCISTALRGDWDISTWVVRVDLLLLFRSSSKLPATKDLIIHHVWQMQHNSRYLIYLRR